MKSYPFLDNLEDLVDSTGQSYSTSAWMLQEGGIDKCAQTHQGVSASQALVLKRLEDMAGVPRGSHLGQRRPEALRAVFPGEEDRLTAERQGQQRGQVCFRINDRDIGIPELHRVVWRTQQGIVGSGTGLADRHGLELCGWIAGQKAIPCSMRRFWLGRYSRLQPYVILFALFIIVAVECCRGLVWRPFWLFYGF